MKGYPDCGCKLCRGDKFGRDGACRAPKDTISHCPDCKEGQDHYTYAGSRCMQCDKKHRTSFRATFYARPNNVRS